MYDVFISYASEDREAIAYPLAQELIKNGYNVWYDEFSISLGSSIRQSIDKGIRKSKYYIVILSKAFFNKGWTNYELDGLVEVNIERPGTLLPIWFNVSKSEVAEYSKSLSNILSIKATNNSSISNIVIKLNEIMGEYYYYVNSDEEIVRTSSKVNISPSDRKTGSQIIKSINTDQLIDKTTCICTNEAIVYPYGDMEEYKFNYWQALKGEIQVITHMAYDYYNGSLISTNNTISKNDGHRLLSVVHFKRISDGPIRIICKISTTNLHSCLFNNGFSDMGFNHGANIELFSYEFVMPNKIDFRNIHLLEGGKECIAHNIEGQIRLVHKIKNVKIGTNTDYKIINSDFIII